MVVFHLFFETFGVAFPAFRNDLTRTISGDFDVSVFFVLSGEALSASFFAGGGARALASLATRRHSRLSIPIFVLVLVVIGLQRADLVFAAPAAAVVHRPDWLGRLLTQPIDLAAAVKYSLLRVYLIPDSNGHLIPFLWTMSAEMVGSLFVFAMLGLWSGLRRHEAVLLALIALFEATWTTAFLACFACGLLFGAWRTSGLFARLATLPLARAASLGLIIVALVIADLAPEHEMRVHAAAAMLLLGAIHASPLATRAFRSGPSRLLGRLSFPLYLVHFAVIISFTSWAILWADAHGGLTEARALAIGLASVAVALVGAVAFEPVEILTRHVGHLLARTFVVPRA